MYMKNFRILLALAVSLMTVGCYNDFDEPAPAKVWSEKEVQELGLQHISIADMKAKYSAPEFWGSIEHNGGNKADDTNTLKMGPARQEEAGFKNLKFWDEAADMYIKGKVISSDEQGNIYKSLYIDDGTAAIELKLCGTMFTTFKLDIDNLESMWVYVKLKDMYLGNYRMMLSLGDAPSNGLNASGTDKYYGNSNFESDLLWRNPAREEFNRVLVGEPCRLVLGENIIEINKDNFMQFRGKEGEKYHSRLVRIKDAKVKYANIKYQNKNADGSWSEDIQAASFNPQNNNPFPNWIVTDWGKPEFDTWFRWAYSRNGVSLTGSVLVTVNDNAKEFKDGGVFSVRTSGYSRFAMKPIPMDGAVGDVLGLYGIYAKSYDKGSYTYEQYQITVNRVEDLKFPKSSLLTEEWIEHNTPESAYKPRVKNGAGEYEDLE